MLQPSGSIEHCAQCNGTGWKSVEAANGAAYVVRCDCWRESVTRRLLADARIPRRYQHCTLNDFVTYDNETLEDALARARKLAEAFPVVGRGLFFLGDPGVGKTHLAVAIVKQVVLTRGARALFYDTRDLLKVIRSTYNAVVKTTELEVLRPVMEADLLVLDDLGAEKTSEWVEETLNLIVNTRYNERRLTIFTSNYPDIPDDTDPQALLFRIGARMRSRLHEMCEFVVLDAADYRERPDNASVEDLTAMWKLRNKSALPSPRGGRQARAQLRDGKGDLKWSGGRAGS